MFSRCVTTPPPPFIVESPTPPNTRGEDSVHASYAFIKARSTFNVFIHARADGTAAAAADLAAPLFGVLFPPCFDSGNCSQSVQVALLRL